MTLDEIFHSKLDENLAQQYLDGILARLRTGAEEYGEQSFALPMHALFEEIMHEAFDICGWTYIVYVKLGALFQKIQQLEGMVEEADHAE
jgi:hypothetical protein